MQRVLIAHQKPDHAEHIHKAKNGIVGMKSQIYPRKHFYNQPAAQHK